MPIRLLWTIYFSCFRYKLMFLSAFKCFVYAFLIFLNLKTWTWITDSKFCSFTGRLLNKLTRYFYKFNTFNRNVRLDFCLFAFDSEMQTQLKRLNWKKFRRYNRLIFIPKDFKLKKVLKNTRQFLIFLNYVKRERQKCIRDLLNNVANLNY